MGIQYSLFLLNPSESNNFINNFLKKNELSREVYELLQDIKKASSDAYSALLLQLHNISDTSIINIQAHHFNTVARLLLCQRLLSPNIVNHVKTYLKNVKPETKQIIQNLRVKYLPKLNVQAKINNLTHHSLDHGVELKARSMQVITQDLEMYNTDSDYDVFMRNLLSFAFEAHDYFQIKEDGKYATVEEKTADTIINWLSGEDGFPQLSAEVSSWISYQITYMIPIATTIAFSLRSPIHLTKLLGFFEKACEQAQVSVCAPSNLISCLDTQLIAHIIGCMDTIPYAMCNVVKRQTNSKILATDVYLTKLRVLNSIENNEAVPMSIIKEIIFSEGMQLYFNGESPNCNFQAFAISLVSKLGMTIELANLSKNEVIKEKAILIGNFIREMKSLYSNVQNIDFMIKNFNNIFDERDIGGALEILFLREENIAIEKDFAISNLGRACIVNRIVELYFNQGKKNTHVESKCFIEKYDASEIILPNAILADANNIVKFFQGYQKLSANDKKLALKEITLNLVIQAGRVYLKHPYLEEIFDGRPRKISTSYNEANNFVPVLQDYDDSNANEDAPNIKVGNF